MILVILKENRELDYIHHQPQLLQKTDDELLSMGVFIESFPQSEVREGFYSVMKWNDDTKEIYYEYVAVPAIE